MRAMAELTTVDALAQVSFLVQGTLERRAAEHDCSLIQTRLLGILRDRGCSHSTSRVCPVWSTVPSAADWCAESRR
jgi:hypothetical protein